MTETNYSYFTDPGQEFLLQQQSEQDLIRQRMMTQVGQDSNFMNNLAQYSLLYPTGSAELGLALSQGGIPASNPLVQGFINTELQTRDVLGPVDKAGGGLWDGLTGIWDEWVDNPMKGSVRWGFSAWDAAYQMLAGGAPIRARELAQQEGISFSEAWSQQDPFFFEALGGVFAGERVNLGSGWMPNSDVADDVREQVNTGMEQVERDTADLGANDRYIKRIEASPQIWRDAVSGSLEQSIMGRPLTQQNFADTESVIFDVDPWRSDANPNGIGLKTRTPWSIGRIIGANLVEPGTEPFHKISGFLDFNAQIFLDPVDWVGGFWFKAGRNSRKIWAEASKIAGEVKAVDGAATIQKSLPPGSPRLALPAGDETRALIGDMGPTYPHGERTVRQWDETTQSYEDVTEYFPNELPGRDPYIVSQEGTKLPWWLSPIESAKRVVRAFDPPEWFIDAHRASRRGATARAATTARSKPKRVIAGIYEIELPRIPGTKQQKLKIQRIGTGRNKYWEVVAPDGSRVGRLADDPRFDAPQVTQFRTLDEATEAANNYAFGAYPEELRVHGMTADEFIESGESFYVGDDIAFLKSTGRRNVGDPAVMHNGRKYGPDTPASQRGNARIHVFGKTIDLSNGVVDSRIPAGLKAALRRDRKLRGDRLVGFGDPQIEKFENTLHWMENNGVGKLHWDDETVLIADKFVGGSTKDPQLRMWYEDGNKPMHTLSEGMESPTPREVDEFIQTVADTGRVIEPKSARAAVASDRIIDVPISIVRKWMDPGVTTDPKVVDRIIEGGAGSSGGSDIGRKGVGEVGFDEPIDVIFGKHRGIDGPIVSNGHHRIEAAIREGIDSIPVRVTDYDSGKGVSKGAMKRLLDTLTDSERQSVKVSKLDDGAGVIKGGGAAGEGFQMPGVTPTHPGVAGQVRHVVDERAAALAAKVDDVNLSTAPSPVLDSGVRLDYDPTFKLQGKKVEQFIGKLAAVTRAGGQKTHAMMDNFLSFFEKQGQVIPNSVRKELFEAKTPEALKNTLAKWLTTEGGQEFLLPGGTSFGRLASVPGVRPMGISLSDNRWFARQMAESLGSGGINMVEDPSKAYRLFNRALPHYKLKRGDMVQKYDDAGKVLEGQFVSVEATFDRLRDLRPGDKPEAFAIMGEFSQLMFGNLVSEGVDPRLAKRSSQWWIDNGEKALFEAERYSRVDLGSSPYDMTLVPEGLLGGVGPQDTASLWSGALTPIDARTMRRISSQSDLLGRISGKMSYRWVDEDGTLTLHDRAVIRALDGLVQKVWKPLVLLRAAWTIRIAMDDQFRLAAEGYSILNHPLRVFNYALTRPGDWKDAFMKGKVDVFGTMMEAKHVDEMMHGDIFRASLMRAHDPKLGPGAYGHNMHEPVFRGHSQYAEGLMFELTRFRGSPMTKILANSKSNDPVDEAVKWLQGKGRKGSQESAAVELANQAELTRKMPGYSEKIMEGDYDTLYEVVSRQHASLHSKMGGDVVLDNGRGQLFSMGQYAPVGTTMKTGKAKWIVRSDGDEDLLALVAGKKRIGETFYGNIDTVESRKLVEQLIKRKVKATDSRFPQVVRVPKEQPVLKGQGTIGESLNAGIAGLFDFFMTRPSNFLSRSPEFRRAYWRKVSDLYPYMDDALRKQIDDLIPLSERANVARALKDKRLPDIEGQLTDLDQVDLHAKSYGLTMVEQTLFSLTNELSGRRNISDALRLVFPFAEAWGEFISRWGRLMVTGDRNIKNLNRLRQSVNGARRSGFFSENDYGQEVFSYPAFMTKGQVAVHNTLNNIPFVGAVLGEDVSQQVSGNIEATASVESLNFASGVIPGFGPVFQMAAKQLPDNPDFDWLRDFIAPFGTEGGITASFAPAWLKRVVSAHGGQNDPQLTYAYNSAVIDVIRTKIDNGEFSGITDPASINALVKEAEGEARGLLMVRAAATFWNPSAPQYKFQKEDVDGLVWSYNNLGSEYYKMEQELGEDEAYAEFYRRFGFLPQAFRGGKSYSILDRSRTESGSKFERSHSEVFEAYPSIAMYFDPNIADDSPYDHSATLAQLRKGLRENWTGEQFVYLQQDQLGDMWWDNVVKTAELIPTSDMKKAYKASMRDEISALYPFWNERLPGKRSSVTNDQQMADVQRALTDPSVSGTPALRAAKIYEGYRQEVLEQIRRAGASTIDGPKSTTTDAGRIATRGREWLREKAQELSIEFPQFDAMYRSVYAYEVNVTHDAPVPPVIDAYGEGDIFEELGVTDGGE